MMKVYWLKLLTILELCLEAQGRLCDMFILIHPSYFRITFYVG